MRKMQEIKTTYYPNGNPMDEYPMVNGMLRGWRQDGTLWYTGNALNGQSQGMSQDWNKNGTRDQIYQFKNHNRHGSKIKFKYK